MICLSEKYPIKIPASIYYGGQWHNSRSSNRIPIINPATEEEVGTFQDATIEDVKNAVESAKDAHNRGKWLGITSKEREDILHKISELILENREKLAFLETIDVGKPYKNAYSMDIIGAARSFRYFAGWITKIYGETTPVDPQFFNYTLREPMGVVGVITPWNFPLASAAKKIALSLATGNCVVFKPSEETVMTALELPMILKEAGVPDGVFNLVTGFGETVGNEIVKSPDIDMISFTGHHITGTIIQKSASDTLKKCVLELGGKSPNIVFDDANIEEAVNWSYKSAFFNQGENCNAGTRLFLDRKIKERFLKKFIKLTNETVVGDPFDNMSTMGPMISRTHYDKVTGYINYGEENGYDLLAGGAEELKLFNKGYFISPTIFNNVPNDSKLAQEEIFGPVLSIVEFDDVEDAIEKANNVIYGLAGSVHTTNLSKAHYLARKLNVGNVWINCHGVADPTSPYGGRKLSGVGTEGGPQGIYDYTQMKSVWVNIHKDW